MIDRARIWAGETVTLPRSDASAALAQLAREHAGRSFSCEPSALRTVHDRGDARELWRRTCAARAALARCERVRTAARELATWLGFEQEHLAIDTVRLRVIAPKAHENAAAARAFYTHRDTWYASPSAQINIWIPLFDVDATSSFWIFPSAFGAAVENDSARFEYRAFASRGGFQSANLIDAAYPRCLERVPEQRVAVHAHADDVFVFSPAHLHGTIPNETQRTRFSIDVRLVDVRDRGAGRGARNVDNKSCGDASVDYMRAAS